MNSGKCHLILSLNDENKKIKLNSEIINNTKVQKGGKKDSCTCLSYKVHV